MSRLWQRYVALPQDDGEESRALPIAESDCRLGSEDCNDSGLPSRRHAHIRTSVTGTPMILSPSSTVGVSRLRIGSEATQQEAEIHESRTESPFIFVNEGWFHAITAAVLIGNIAAMVAEANDSAEKHTLFVVDQLMLVFYILELSCRVGYFRSDFIFGPARLVAWNMLDVAVVSAGMITQWLIPFLPMQSHPIHFWLFLRLLRMLRFVRLLRALKIIRVIMDADLSCTEGPKFNSFIGLVILVNAIIMGFETDMEWPGWAYIEQILLCIYVFELIVRLKRLGAFYLSWDNPDMCWNCLDFTIVVTSTTDTWILPILNVLCGGRLEVVVGTADSQTREGRVGPVMMFIRTLRLMRILRLARLLKSFRPLYILVTGVMAALQGVFWVLVLTFTVLYAMGIMATRMIGHGMIFAESPPENIIFPFKSVPDSMFTLFRVMSGSTSQSESTAIDALMSAVPAVKFAFVYFLVTSSWTLLSTLTAVVSENMITVTGQEEEAMRISDADEDRLLMIKHIKVLFNDIDKGHVEEGALDAFLADKGNSLSTARYCKMAVHDVREVLHILRSYGRDVTMAEFADKLVDAKHPATERSVMKIEARLSAMQLRTEALLDSLDRRLEASKLLEQSNCQMQGPVSERMMVMLDHLYAKEQRTSQAISSLRDSVRGLHEAAGRPPDAEPRSSPPLPAVAQLLPKSLPAADAPDRIALLLERFSAEERRSNEALLANMAGLHDAVGALRSEALRESAARRSEESSLNSLAAQLEASIAELHGRGTAAIRELHAEGLSAVAVRRSATAPQAMNSQAALRPSQAMNSQAAMSRAVAAFSDRQRGEAAQEQDALGDRFS